MKVLIVSGESISVSSGGIGSSVFELCKELDRRNIFYKVVYSNKFKFETEKGIFLPSACPLSSPLGVGFGLSFKKFIKKEKDNWDVIHFHLPSAQWPAAFSHLSCGKNIMTFHTTWKGYEKYVYSNLHSKYLEPRSTFGRIFRKGEILLEKIALRNAARITAVSSGVKNEINLWYSNKRVDIIHHGIDVEMFSPSGNLKKDDRPTILYVGRLVAQKGIFLGIDALAMIKNDFDFLVVGEGVLQKKIEKYCSKKNVAVKFLGRINRENLPKIYSKADILLMPSVYEGLPLVGVEGACMELPIVAFEGARVEDIVCEENKPFISRTGDVKALSESIRYLLENPKVRKAISKKNREKILKEFSATKMADSYIKCYEEVMSK